MRISVCDIMSQFDIGLPPEPRPMARLADIDKVAALDVGVPSTAFLDDIPRSDHAAKLLNLTGLALDRAADVLASRPEKASEYYSDELRATTTTIKTVLATQLRVDENHLRRRATDTLPELLKEIAAAEGRLNLKGITNALQP